MPKPTCSVPNCADPHSARGLCGSHYARWRRTGDPGAALTTRRRNPLTRDADGRKQCRMCDAWLDESAFFKSATKPDGLGAECRDCHRGIGLLRRYGVTLDWYSSTLEKQGGGCAICGDKPGTARWMHVDHAHGCCEGCPKCVRGILCTRCNTGIGMFREDPRRLDAARAYLEAHGD